MPEITEAAVSDMKTRSKSMEKSVPEQYCVQKTEEKVEIEPEISCNIDFETTVHRGFDL